MSDWSREVAVQRGQEAGDVAWSSFLVQPRLGPYILFLEVWAFPDSTVESLEVK